MDEAIRKLKEDALKYGRILSEERVNVYDSAIVTLTVGEEAQYNESDPLGKRLESLEKLVNRKRAVVIVNSDGVIQYSVYRDGKFELHILDGYDFGKVSSEQNL